MSCLGDESFKETSLFDVGQSDFRTRCEIQRNTSTTGGGVLP